MPCTPRKARILLHDKKATIVSYKPFTIKLVHGCKEYTQPIDVGIDLGAKHIGIAIVSEEKILAKGEITLRTNVKELLETRRIYRRARRSRKTRYRKARFLNRKKSKKKGWLPPSIQSRIDNTFQQIDKIISLLPKPKLHIEVGKFNIQKIKDPSIAGKDYQQGDSYGFYSIRYYVFERDKYTCQVCGKKDKILRTHHIRYRSHNGSDAANNLITVCTDCHTSKNHQPGGIFYKWMTDKKAPRSYKEATFMNIIKQRVFVKYPEAHITYGNITTPDRKLLGLEKTHYNDAIAITGIKTIKHDIDSVFKILQARKKKRSLHEAKPRKGIKAPNTTQYRRARNTKVANGIFLNDSIILFGKRGFVSGFSQYGKYISVIDINDNIIKNPTKKSNTILAKEVKVIGHNNNWRYDYIYEKK